MKITTIDSNKNGKFRDGSILRICLFSPDARGPMDDQKFAANKMLAGVDPHEAEFTFLTNYPWLKQGDDKNVDEPYIMSGSSTWQMRTCRKLLQLRNKGALIPSVLVNLAVSLCANNILESLMAADPDLVVCSDTEWAKQLGRLLKQQRLPWLCVGPGERLPRATQEWRKYDPAAKVSIILPTYNGSKYLRRSVESCLNQTHQNIELIIVDDGSREPVKTVLAPCDDPRLRILRHDRNRGVAASINTGFSESSGDYLTWTSDDNYYAPNALQELLSFLQTYHSIDFVYADSYVIDEQDLDQPRKIWRTRPPQWLKHDNGVGASFLYKRKVYETIGEYKSEMFLAEDYDYWVRVSKRFSMQRLFRPLYYYRRHAGSLTAKHRPEQVWEKVKLVKQVNKIGA